MDNETLIEAITRLKRMGLENDIVEVFKQGRHIWQDINNTKVVLEDVADPECDQVKQDITRLQADGFTVYYAFAQMLDNVKLYNYLAVGEYSEEWSDEFYDYTEDLGKNLKWVFACVKSQYTFDNLEYGTLLVEGKNNSVQRYILKE